MHGNNIHVSLHKNTLLSLRYSLLRLKQTVKLFSLLVYV
jgi:hypothetical protein